MGIHRMIMRNAVWHAAMLLLCGWLMLTALPAGAQAQDAAPAVPAAMPAEPGPAPAAVPVQPGTTGTAEPLTSAPAPVMPATVATPESDRRVVLNGLLAWRKAWMEGDVATYLGCYDANFKGDLPSRAAWEKQRRERVAARSIMVRIENLTVRVTGEEANAEFTQSYASNVYEDAGQKVMKLRKIGGKWLIVEEKWRKA